MSGSIVATPEHEFWVDGKGWATVARLKVGDWLMDNQGQRVLIRTISEVAGPVSVYTLSNREDHAFYANDLLVRDSCGDRYPLPVTTSRAKATQPQMEVVR